MNEKYAHIALDLIDEDVSNHRLVVDGIADDALAASIKANGVQQPIKLAKKPDGRFTLVFGFRRTTQARKLGLPSIPAIIVDGLNATEIRSLQAIENLERKELHPMEEAQFCQDLHDTLDPHNHGGTYMPELIAQRVGRSVKWVENRLALARLSPRVKECFLAGDIQLQHAQLIGRLVSHEAQEEVLGNVRAHEPHFGKERERIEGKYPPATILKTRGLVEARLSDLSDVTWKLDAEFDGKPACSNCPHNSANRLDLFDGDAPKKAQCLNTPCYKEKRRVAGLAVQKASNTLAKSEDKKTPTNAKKAMEERGLMFVDEKAVAEAAKYKMPSVKAGGTPTVSEQRGEKNAQRDSKIRSELYDRQMKWNEKAIEAVDAHLPHKNKNVDAKGRAIGLACMLLIREAKLIDPPYYVNKKAAAVKVSKALKMLPGADEKTLVDLVLLLGSDLQTAVERDKWFHPLFGEDSCDDAIAQLAEIYSIEDIGKPPTFESVEAELYPPATKEAKPTGKKVRGKAKEGKVTYHTSGKQSVTS